jgi:hypothetical protein
MLKNLAIAFGLVAGLSACAAPYGYPGYGNTGYGYGQAPYYGYSNEPVYYGPVIHPAVRTEQCNLDQARSIVRYGPRRIGFHDVALPSMLRACQQQTAIPSRPASWAEGRLSL